MKEIPLTMGKVALVDDEDFWDLVKFKWCARRSHKNFYAISRVSYKRSTICSVHMHDLVMLAHPDYRYDLEVDHIDRNGLNNQKHNLRMVTHRQNIQNSRVRPNRTGFKGVRREHTKNERWSAMITIDGKPKYLGAFDTPLEAALAYNKAATEHFGEYACLNPIPTIQ